MKDNKVHFLELFHNNLMGLILTDEDHIIVDVNEHLLHLTDMESSDVIGKTGMEIGMLNEKFVKDMWQQLTENGRVSNQELSFTSKKNRKLDMLFSTERIKLEDKNYWLTTLIDISKRRKTEQELSDVYSRVTDGVVAFDASWNYTYVNKSAGVMMERDTVEMIGRNVWVEFPYLAGSDIQQAYFKAMENQEMISLEQYFPPFDIWYLHMIYPSPGAMSVFFKDISFRKKNEQRIEESELRFRTLTKNAPVGIFETDADGITTYVNESWMQFTGMQFEEAMGEGWLDAVHVDDRKQLLKGWYDKSKMSEPSSSEYRLIDKAGKERWVAGNAVPLISDDGRITGYLGTVSDITDAKKYELVITNAHQKMDTLINTIDGIVWEANARTFQFTYISKQAGEILGYPVEQWLNDHQFWGNHIHPEDKSRAVDYCVTCTREKKQHDFEYRMIAKDGSIVWLRDIVSVIVENDEPVQLRGIMIDISEQKEAQRVLQERTEELRELGTHLQNVREEERMHIAREIHDELGQQLTGLKMDVAWLMKKVDQHDPAIKLKFDGMLKLIDGTVKSIRRISTELRPSVLDDLGLNAALEWLVDEFGERLTIEIEYKNSFNDEHIAPEIAIGLFRILQESLTNIARHAGAAKATINIKKADDSVQLTVCDDGKGFNTAPKKNRQTFGLLGIKERVNKMKGDFKISSTPGNGTIVEVLIPL